MNFKDLPIFIISYNRLSDLKHIVKKLKEDGYTNINIVDNCSDDIELKKYLETVDCKVFLMDKNYGHMVVWDSGYFSEIIENSYYVVTDPDVIPVEDCPDNYVEYFYNMLMKYPDVSKVGFSLKIDDLPVFNRNRMHIVRWESFFYENVICEDPVLYRGDIDTTFALYRPGKIKNFYNAIRTGKPYEARHLPWYWNLNDLDTEKEYYIKNANKYGNTYINSEKIKKYSLMTMIKIYNDEKYHINEWKQEIYRLYISRHKHTYLYGTGKIGKKLANYFNENSLSFDGFIVSDGHAGENIEFMGYNVFELSLIKHMNIEGLGIIIATGFEKKVEILKYLYQEGFTDVCSIEM